MKKVMILFSIIALNFGCGTKCPPSAVTPKSISFQFSIVDKNGKDLFFGKDSIYDPKNIKFAVGQDESEIPQDWFYISELEKCFTINGFLPKIDPYTFYFEFVTNDIDTLVIDGYSDKVDNCTGFGRYHKIVYFNDSLICTDCSDEIYKIVK